MTNKAILLGAAVMAAAQAVPAQAAQGDILLRLRGIMVAPNEKSGSVLPGFPGEKVKIDNSVMPEIDVEARQKLSECETRGFVALKLDLAA